MIHLFERRHNERYLEMMDSLMPTWRSRRDEVNRAPLAYDDWSLLVGIVEPNQLETRSETP